MVVSTNEISSKEILSKGILSKGILSMSVGPDPEQRLAELDEVAVRHQNALDHAGGFGLDAGEHFHDLDEPDGGAGRDLGADGHERRLGGRRGGVELAHHGGG